MHNVNIFFFHLGYNCGPIKAESILSSRQTVSRQIKSNASIGREKIQHVLLKAARERCLVLSSDIEPDDSHQRSYLECLLTGSMIIGNCIPSKYVASYLIL